MSVEVDLHAVVGRTITGVNGYGRSLMNDRSVRFESIFFDLDENSLLVKVDPDTDEVLLSLIHRDSSRATAPIEELRRFVGCSVGWCWTGRNSQGYQDMFAMGFGDGPEGLEPKLTLLAEASSLSLYTFARVTGV